jgi:hypothetical protein
VILTENMNMRCIAVQFVPPTLDNWSKVAMHKLCLELQEKANKGPTFISRIIMGDKSWIYSYDPETKQQSSQWKSPHSPRAKKAWRGRSGVQQRACSLFFLTWRGLFIVNLFLLTLRSTLTFTMTFWDAWEKMCDEKPGTLAQPRLAPSSRQCACPHVPENHRVCD